VGRDQYYYKSLKTNNKKTPFRAPTHGT
jgi:hypothetical protein